MNHHRLGISALILLIFLTIIHAYQTRHFVENLVTHTEQIPFGGTVPVEITHGNTEKKQIIFTFDGGDGAQSASTILDVLAKHHVKGTFFLTGKWVINNPDAVKRMKSDGHEIYNHTFDHPHLPMLEDSEIIREFMRMDLMLSGLTGSSSKPYFRPPYGDRDERVRAVASRAGYQSVMWTVDAGDWMESEGFTAEEVRARIFSHIEPGAIILMHIGDTITGAILDDVFTAIESEGYSLVPLSKGME